MANKSNIYIAPSKRGTFTAAASRRGLGVQEFASKVLANPSNYSEAMRKKAQFAKNATRFEHAAGGEVLPQYALGGDIFGGSMGGASAGASIGMLGGPVGSAIGAGAGALLGGVSGLFSGKAKERERKRQEAALRFQNSVNRGMANLAAQGPQETYSATFENGGEVDNYTTPVVMPSAAKYNQDWLNARKNILASNIAEGANSFKAAYADRDNTMPYLNDFGTREIDPIQAAVYSNPTAQGALNMVGDRYGKMKVFAPSERTAFQKYAKTKIKDSAFGAYAPWSHTMLSGDDQITNVHEWAHGSGVQELLRDSINNRTSKYADQVDSYNWKNDTQKSYFIDPDEIHSRLMELRYKYQLDPTKKITKEDMIKMRDSELMESMPNDLLQIFDDDAMMDYLNNIASTNTTNSEIKMARKGALIMENGGTVSQRDVAASNAVNTLKNKAVAAWDTIQVIQDPLYTSKMLHRFSTNKDIEMSNPMNIEQGGEAEKYIRSKWEYPYSSYTTLKDKKTGSINYYPVLTNTQLDELRKYAIGGSVQGANVELEGGESVVTPDGTNMNVNGPSHEQGGVPMQLPNASRVFSDTLKVPGTKETFSDANKKYAKQITKLQDILDDQRSTRLSKRTAEKMLTKLESKQDQLFNTQQMLNGNSNGEFKGGLPKGTNGMEYLQSKGLTTQTPSTNLYGMDTYKTQLANEQTAALAGSKGINWGQGFAKAGNIIGGIAEAAPMLYNIGQGLFGKSESFNPSDYANPAAEYAVDALRKRTVNIDPQLAASRTAFNTANRNITGASRTRGERMSGYATTAAAKGLTDASIYAGKQNTENQYVGEAATMAANLGQQQAATNLNIAEYNAKSRAMRESALSLGLGQLGQYAQSQKTIRGQQRADQMRINAMSGLMPNYDIDFNTGKTTFKK